MTAGNGVSGSLARFLDAQARDYATALAELRSGRKQSHWIWYVLPQLRGLGRSAMAEFYGIASLDEARAYLDHPVLGARLRECVAAMNLHDGLSAEEILGVVDAMKYRSCLTLFDVIEGRDSCFRRSLAKYFHGERDPVTLALLGRDPPG